MQSKALTVDEYLATVPPDRMNALKILRRICLEELTGFEERMMYGGPCYTRNGIAEVGFMSQKQYISLYILKKEVLDRYRPQLAGLSIGKCCIRYTKPGKIDFEVVRGMLRRV